MTFLFSSQHTNHDRSSGMADIHKDGAVAGNISLLTSQLYSDITIRCSSVEYKLHRAIICPRSSFFTAACSGEFIVSISRGVCVWSKADFA